MSHERGLGVVVRVLMFVCAGAVIGGLVGWFMFGGTQYDASTGHFGIGPIMAPAFAVIGAIGALLSLTLASGLLAVHTRLQKGAGRAKRVSPYTAEWENPSNWTAGLFYRSRVDRRIFVPQKSGIWFTINFGQPLGIVVSIVFLIVLVVTIFSLIAH